MDFTDLLNVTLTRKGQDYLWLAVQVGASESASFLWTTGQNVPRYDYLPDLARVLGVDEDELVQAWLEINDARGNLWNVPYKPGDRPEGTWLEILETGLRRSQEGVAGLEGFTRRGVRVRCAYAGPGCRGEYETSEDAVRTGSRSCGCYRAQVAADRNTAKGKPVYVGDVYGEYEILGTSYRRARDGRRVRAALCRCSCGNLREVYVSNLLRKRAPVQSCGHDIAISPDVVAKLREMYATGKYSQRELCSVLGLTPATVSRYVRGIDVIDGRSKLTPGQRIEIRDRARSGERTSVLAREYGISPARVSDIKHGRS